MEEFDWSSSKAIEDSGRISDNQISRLTVHLRLPAHFGRSTVKPLNYLQCVDVYSSGAVKVYWIDPALFLTVGNFADAASQER